MRDDATIARGWIAQAQRDEVRRGLEDIFSSVSREIESRGPACWASGRCCNFDKAGHRLYVTGLEAAYTLVHLPKPEATPAPGRVTLPQAREGCCPFLVGNACGVHSIKPLGCRVYFCDRSAKSWQEDLSEQMLARLRALHDRFGVEYRYAEWRTLLAMVAAVL